MERVFSFLQLLQENNHKDWFQANQTLYKEAKTEIENFASRLIEGVAAFEPEIANLKPKECTFRINRDVRFSADKSPYKTNMSLILVPGGKKAGKACYYLHLQDKGSFVAGGIYAPEKEVLEKIRQEIDYNLDEFNEILRSDGFTTSFAGLDSDIKLKKQPKGYESDNPAVEYLKLKSFTASGFFDNEKAFSKDFYTFVLDGCKALYPLNQFLNRAIS
jgi:uncharacterized protein (TIGR02453 family)